MRSALNPGRFSVPGHNPVDQRNSEVDGMRISRRAFLGSVAVGAAFSAVPSCTHRTTEKPIACLPKVKVAPERMIHTMAGLRPNRPGGFVVRPEAFGDKHLVHNYGHG